MLVFGCKEKLNLILKKGDEEIVKAIKWKGRKSSFLFDYIQFGLGYMKTITNM